MCRSLGALVFGVLAIGALVAGQASAGPLSSASLTLQLGTLPPASFPGVGATGTATSNLSASLVAGTAFNGSVTTSVPTSVAPPLSGIQMLVTNGATGTFVGSTPNSVGGNLAIQGAINVDAGGYPLLAIPLNIGTPNTVFKSDGGVSITAIGAGWTAGTAVVTGITTTTTPSYASNMAGTAMMTGANGLTVGGAGTLVLVTPVKILTNVAGNLAAFGTLTLNYVPEPGSLLLLGAGIVGLTALGRRRI